MVHLKAHAVFKRDNDDLHCEMPISFATAALGGEITIPTLDGQAVLDGQHVSSSWMVAAGFPRLRSRWYAKAGFTHAFAKHRSGWRR
mgnify:CR=1 FL=1